MRLFLILSLLSFSALATTWDNLHTGKTYKLGQSFALPQTAKPYTLLDFMQGESVRLTEVTPLTAPGVLLYLYTFDYLNCPVKEMQTSMEIVPVNGTSPLVEAGVSLENNCELTVYIEQRDFYAQSLFE